MSLMDGKTSVNTQDDTDMNTRNRCNGQTVHNLLIGNDEELEEFWREILPDFVKVVQPRQSGFLDSLMENGLLTETDDESMSGKDVRYRQMQARKLWHLLRKLPLHVFKSKVETHLCDLYYHIIPLRFRATPERCQEENRRMTTDQISNTCLRHIITSHVRLVKLADILCHLQCITFHDHEYITKHVLNKTVAEECWETLFRSLCSAESDVLLKVEDVVRKWLIERTGRSPVDLIGVLTQGTPCTCNHPLLSTHMLDLPTSPMPTTDKVFYELDQGVMPLESSEATVSLSQVEFWLEEHLNVENCSISSDGKLSSTVSPASTLRSAQDPDTTSMESDETLVEARDLSIPQRRMFNGARDSSVPRSRNSVSSAIPSQDLWADTISVHHGELLNQTSPTSMGAISSKTHSSFLNEITEGVKPQTNSSREPTLPSVMPEDHVSYRQENVVSLQIKQGEATPVIVRQMPGKRTSKQSQNTEPSVESMTSSESQQCLSILTDNNNDCDEGRSQLHVLFCVCCRCIRRK